MVAARPRRVGADFVIRGPDRRGEFQHWEKAEEIQLLLLSYSLCLLFVNHFKPIQLTLTQWRFIHYLSGWLEWSIALGLDVDLGSHL